MSAVTSLASLLQFGRDLAHAAVVGATDLAARTPGPADAPTR